MGSEWSNEHYTCYRTYLIFEIVDVPEAIVFDYGGSFALGAAKHPLSLEKGPDQQVGPWHERPRMKHGSGGLPESRNSKLRLSTSVLEARNTLKGDRTRT